MKRVAIIGAGGHGKVIRDTLSLQAGVEIVGFYDDDTSKAGLEIDGTVVRGPLEELRARRAAEAVVVAIGDNRTRARLFEEMKALGYEMLSAVHPFCVLSASAQIGAGFVAMAGAIVNPGTRIGDDVCVNTGASVDHDCCLGDHCMIYPNASLAGGVTIGAYATIGSNATINQYLRVGANSLVGAGAVVTRDVPEAVMVAGVPARVLRENT